MYSRQQERLNDTLHKQLQLEMVSERECACAKMYVCVNEGRLRVQSLTYLTSYYNCVFGTVYERPMFIRRHTLRYSFTQAHIHTLTHTHTHTHAYTHTH